MDMYQKRKMRQEKKNNNQEEKLTKVGINWYPGHMVKAQNEIKDSLKLIDVVVEVLDARIPMSSSNPIIDNLASNKERIVVLNKVDLADKSNLDEWKKYFENKGYMCICSNTNNKEDIKKIIDAIITQGNKAYSKKGKKSDISINQIYRVLIVGIPNVGKSTLINKIAKRQAANVSNKPGVTVRKQWIRVQNNIELLDTPGLLWPRLDDNDAGVKLALTGNIKQEILEVESLACEGLKILLASDKYKKMLEEKYKIDSINEDIDVYELLELIGRKRGCIVSGGNVDMEKAAKAFLDDLKSGKIGNISFENVI